MSADQTDPSQAPAARKLPGSFGLFYGWVIVAVLGVAGGVGMGMGLLNIGLFIKPMGDDLGISRALFGWAQTLRQVGGALTSPLYGTLVDRFGSRLLLPLAVVITGLSMIYLGTVESGTGLLIALALIGVAGYSVPGAIITSVPVMKWFEASRGKAMAVVSVFTLVGSMIFLPLTQYLIDTLGWRDAWTVLAVVGMTLVVPIAAIFLRRQPEDFGLEPDGSAAGDDPEASFDRNHQWTLAAARQTRAFWLLIVLFALNAGSIATIGLHRIPEFMERGLSPMWVAGATAVDAVLASCASIVTGLIAHRFAITRLTAIGFLLLAVSSALTIWANTIPSMLASMALFGVGIGIVMQAQNLVWPEFFGRLHVGQIRGFALPATLIASAVGAPLAGYVFDVTGSYEPVWWVAVVLMLAAAWLSMVVKAPPAP
ncbi:MAG: MFS transporter [Pseudomonadota bacterium]